jgi:hypothetical protein
VINGWKRCSTNSSPSSISSKISLPQAEEATVDPELRILELAGTGDESVFGGMHGMEARHRPHRDKARRHPAFAEILDVLV